ncbi:MAG: response regulator [Deltaproteobacteria bacterium]|nr:response regulator [Candidatus Anaeroferrophillacea bacterium]
MMKILLIDDELPVLGLVSRFLENAGYRVAAFQDGNEALRSLDHEPADVAMVGLFMPDVSGFEIIEVLCRNWPQLPIIAFSGTNRLTDAVKAMRTGAWDFLEKPFVDLAVLPNIIQRVSERAVLMREHIRRDEELRARKEFLEAEVARRTRALQESNRALQESNRALHESRQRLKDIFDNLADVFFQIEPGGRILSVSPSVTRRLGYAVEVVLGTDVRRLVVREADVGRLLHRLEIRRSVDGFELQLRHLDGRPLDYSINVHRVRDSQGKVRFFEGMGRDISDRKRREEEIQQANRQLSEVLSQLQQAHSQMVQQEKLASIGQLAAGVAHELNTPVGFVSSNFESMRGYMMKIKVLVEQYRDFRAMVSADQCPELAAVAACVRTAEEHAHLDFIIDDIDDLFRESAEGFERITTIVTKLREFSRVEQPGEKTPYNLNDAIETTLVVARNEYKYVAVVEKRLASGLPEVWCNAGQINQVLLNIIVNAAQAIRGQHREAPGTITIVTGREGHTVFCRIADDGPGIPPENLGRVFDPFFTTKPVGEGTGLGLNISYDIIVNKHGGEISVAGEPGRGAEFTFRLPVDPEAMDRVTPEKGRR